MKDLDRIYQLLDKEQQELQKFYDVLKPRSLFDTKVSEYEAILEDFLEFINIGKSSETLLAAINRIVNLREDSLLNVIRDFDEQRVVEIRQKAYVWVSEFYSARFERMLEFIDKNELLTPFYRSLLRGAHSIGLVFNSWQSRWREVIIDGVNRELFRLFNGDEERIFQMILEKKLLDMGHNGEIGDRSYSVLRLKDDETFEKVAYSKAFEKETKEIARRIDRLVDDLKRFEDEFKNEWIEYFLNIKRALLEEDLDSLIKRWADVDRSWMKIKSPIQVGHPLEYYEDHYTKAVALEWDVRIANPLYRPNRIKNSIEAMFKRLYLQIGLDVKSVYENTLSNINKTQLYMGRPFSFYGSELNGLFSAQVVPNDEVVSQEFGKKIFAYGDLVYQTQKAKPFMKLHSVIYGKALARKFREILESPGIWLKVYEITTIGHEFGHILWIDKDSESLMNRSGQFKNLEEFKATLGGLAAFFMFEDEKLSEYVLEDTITRAISLIGWMEVDEVLPYYIEGLLHLEGLFSAGVLSFDKKLHINFDRASYEKLKEWYMNIYEELAKHYLQKLDSQRFLEKFILKERNYYPKNKEIRDFVNYYYKLYKEIGTKIDD